MASRLAAAIMENEAEVVEIQDFQAIWSPFGGFHEFRVHTPAARPHIFQVSRWRQSDEPPPSLGPSVEPRNFDDPCFLEKGSRIAATSASRPMPPENTSNNCQSEFKIPRWAVRPECNWAAAEDTPSAAASRVSYTSKPSPAFY